MKESTSRSAIDGFSISKATRTSHVLQLWKVSFKRAECTGVCSRQE